MIVNPPFHAVTSGSGGPPPPSSTTLDPGFSGSSITLSADKLTATAGNGGAGFSNITLSTTGKSSGKWYYEMHLDNGPGSNNSGWGIATHAAPLNAFLGFTCGSVGIQTNIGNVEICGGVAIRYPMAPRIHNYCLCAVDTAAQLIWWGYLAGPVFSGWNPGAGGDPATGTNGFSFSALGPSPYYAALSMENSNIMTINFGGTAFQQSPPSGFTGWGL